MGIWSQAAGLAGKTPEDRNRYVDFLRALSILVVINGHWLIATAYYRSGGLTPGDLLAIQPGTQWLTWLFQVMPIFFIVGGYANGVSLESAKRRGLGYAPWLAGRLNRLVTPLLALLLGWALLALALRLTGVSREVIQLTSRGALIPIWFLAIYIMVVILAPATYKLWRRWGFWSFFAFIALAVLVDLMYFKTDQQWLGLTNYFWVWLAVHHLGYAWRDNRFGSPLTLLMYSALGLGALIAVTQFGPYPLAMAGSPGDGVSNSAPPKITLLALGVFQFGLLLAIQGPMRRALSGLRLWTATVLINSMIMTVYLWHVTVLVIMVSLLYLAGGPGLGLEPGTGEWWVSRPVWLGVLWGALIPVALLLSGLERHSRPADAPVPSAARQIAGAFMICLGVALLAKYGFAGGPQANIGAGIEVGIGAPAFGVVVIGCGVSGLLPGFR